MASLRLPGWEGGHVASGMPQLWLFCASRGGGELPGCWVVPAAAGSLELVRVRAWIGTCTPFGSGRAALAGKGGEVTRQAARPGRGRPAQAGAGEKLCGSWAAPAVANMRQPVLEGRAPGIQLARPWPRCASWGGGEASWLEGRPGRCRSAPAAAGGRADRCPQRLGWSGVGSGAAP